MLIDGLRVSSVDKKKELSRATTTTTNSLFDICFWIQSMFFPLFLIFFSYFVSLFLFFSSCLSFPSFSFSFLSWFESRWRNSQFSTNWSSLGFHSFFFFQHKREETEIKWKSGERWQEKSVEVSGKGTGGRGSRRKEKRLETAHSQKTRGSRRKEKGLEMAHSQKTYIIFFRLNGWKRHIPRKQGVQGGKKNGWKRHIPRKHTSSSSVWTPIEKWKLTL